MNQPLILEKRADGAHVTFNRPDVRNAITREMLADLADFLSVINGDISIRYLIFRGAGAHFSAGGDVAGFGETLKQPPAERQRAYERRLIGNADTFLLLNRIEVPIITVAQGAVAGAGIAFALAADFCLASEDAFFVFAQASLGLPLDLGLSYALPRVVGARKAKALALMSARVKAREAEGLGIVSEVHGADAIERRVEEIVSKLVNGPREAFRLCRALIDASYGSDYASHLEREARAVGEAVAHPDFVEGVSAFLDRRKPAFGGAAASGLV